MSSNENGEALRAPVVARANQRHVGTAGSSPQANIDAILARGA
jgi:hypothetical protein